MNRRSSVAATLVLMLVMEMPVAARAEEAETPAETVPFSIGPALSPIAPRLAMVGARPTPSLAFFASTPDDIRLSRGAKTAIIITAIIVGALIIVGAVAIGRPGRL